MTRPRIHILYEHGSNQRPFGSAYIRLLRPLSHPQLQSAFEVTTGVDYAGQPVEAVIVDRLWRPDISPDLAESLLARIRARSAKLIYTLDDSFFDLPAEVKDWEPTDDRLAVVRIFLTAADGIMVTTPALKNKFAEFNPNIVVLPHALDERLLPPRQFRTANGHSNQPKAVKQAGLLSRLGIRPKQRKVIGYMGTFTHDNDLLMIRPALQAVAERHRGQLELQLVGGFRQPETMKALKQLPLRVVRHKLKHIEYPDFMTWFTQNLDWDVAIAPLADTPFNRCKSDIKFLDYCALGTAGIFSKVPAYEATVRHRETGWLVDNHPAAWREALETLLFDDGLRLHITQNAEQYLFSERSVGQRSADWRQSINMILNHV
ncbi:MAG: glycosyltransferase [Anaerolineae bacterium]|nr:glycosyltransferase [Anaerolineae bacterium]